MKVFPDEETIYDFQFKEKDKEWVVWTKALEKYEIDQKLAYH